jgi:hypothetical protein
VSTYEHCDGCQQVAPTTEEALRDWVRIAPRWLPALWVSTQDSRPAVWSFAFCSWRCLAEYATARSLVTES